MNDDFGQAEPFLKQEHIEIESTGYRAGFNPMFGEWKRTFDFLPASYNNHKKVEPFKRKVRSLLANKFVFTGKVSVSITIYGNEYKMIETGRYGDVDNYAKSIIDALKGNEGLLIDDSQVEHASIGWIDGNEEGFEIVIKGHPDEYAMSNGLALFEMPDKLYYPIPSTLWNYGAPKAATTFEVMIPITGIEQNLLTKAALLKYLRDKGIEEDRAWETASMAGPIKLGFHSSRIRRCGLPLVAAKSWSKDRSAYLSNGDSGRTRLLRFMTNLEKWRNDLL